MTRPSPTARPLAPSLSARAAGPGGPSRGGPAAAARVAAAALLAAALLLTAGAEPLPAQSGERSWRIRDFQVRVDVGEDGSLAVEEELDVAFDGSYNGIYREIPVSYETPYGAGYDLDLEVVSVTGGDGGSLRREIGRDGRFKRIKIWVPGAEDATRTVRLTYRVEHALRFDEQTDELYWNVTGTRWPVPIDRARVRVDLPEGVQGVRTVAYRGPYGSTEQVPTSRGPSGVVTAEARDLAVREGLTVAALWERGVVARPSWLDRLLHFLGSNWPVGAGLLAAAGMAALWWRRGRDPAVGTVQARYEPPEGMRPAAAGILLDHKLHPRDLTATVVDLAVRGYLEIEEGTGDGGDEDGGDEDGYTFRLRRGEEEWTGLDPHEREILEGLFTAGEAGETTDTEQLENSFYREVEDVRDALYRGPLSGLVRERSDEVRQRWLAAGFVVLFFLTVLPYAAEVRLAGAPPGALALGVVIAGLAVGGFGYFMPARTRSGTRKLEEILGFEEFLTRVEEDRFREMIRGPEDFERYLPYAMAFGVAKEWARAFEDLVTEPPEWYAGARGGRFRPVVFTRSMEDFSDSAGSAMTSRPRGQGSSGGSAFSGGGGFSGGGMGGGGGGAF